MEVLRWLESADPMRKAFSDEHGTITYGELGNNARRIGSGLIEALRVRKKPVVVLFERNIESLCAFLGVVYSGNFYVPIDMGQPVDRVIAILNQIHPAAVIRIDAQMELDERISSYCPVLSYEQLLESAISAVDLAAVRMSALDVDPLYAICTSGSTGIPKTVVLSHRSIADFIPNFVNAFGLNSNEVFGNQATFDFSVAAKDIYSTLYCHAQMHIIPKKYFSLPKKLIDCLNQQRITTAIWAVSAVCIISSFNGFKYDIPRYLRNVMFSGEVMPMKQLNIWRKAMPNVRYVNLYGSTEMTCNATYYIVDREFEDTEVLPLGRAFQNKEILVVNEEGKPIGPGESGEIYVRGTCLALGYYNDPERTAKAFTQTPEHNSFPDIVYRTGDLAYLNERGEYVFQCRKDFQIKHMGHRIEVGEIETLAGGIQGVRRACVVFDEKHDKIVLFYDGDAEKMAIIEGLKQKLPKYMLPHVYVKLDDMPLNAHGKIDRYALRLNLERQD